MMAVYSKIMTMMVKQQLVVSNINVASYIGSTLFWEQGRLLHLMQILDVENVVVVVSRWFGGKNTRRSNVFGFHSHAHYSVGILLGADRFKDINNCARKALEDCGYIKDDHKTASKTKRKK